MIVWRGFGFAAVLLGGLGALLGVGLSALVGDGEPNSVLVGIGLLLGAAATFALGWWLNVIRPQQQAQRWATERGVELRQAVDSGRFQAVPGVVPSSYAEAQALSQQMLERETAEVGRRLSGVHTLFWIPMQWIAVVIAGIGVLAMATV